mmetsp:Transcript_133253/g.385675  ORF Transcript_133253/g.385675 Transcript_133253/m.385675 type:complete len:465 (-) Transcript_133253:990-2384(-)
MGVLQCSLRARGAHRNADVSACERSGIVDPVTHHSDAVANPATAWALPVRGCNGELLLQLFYIGHLVFGQQLCSDACNAELGSNERCRATAVSSGHDRLDAQGPQLGQRLQGSPPRRISHAEDESQLAIHTDEADRLRHGLQTGHDVDHLGPIGDPRHLRRQAVASDLHAYTIYSRLNADSRRLLNAGLIGDKLLCAIRHGIGEESCGDGVRGLLPNCCNTTQQPSVLRRVRRLRLLAEGVQHSTNLEHALGECTCLVEEDGAQAAERLHMLTPTDDDIVARRCRQGAHVGDRGGDDDRARACHYQQHQGCVHPLEGVGLVEKQPRQGHATQCEDDDQRCVDPGEALNQHLGLRPCGVRLFDQLDHARDIRVGRRSCSLHNDVSAADVYAAAGHEISKCLLHWHRLTGYGTLINARGARHHDPIQWNLLSSADRHVISYTNSLNRHRLLGLGHHCGLGAQGEYR